MMNHFEVESSTNGLQIRTKGNGFELSILDDSFNLGVLFYWFGITIWVPGIMIDLCYLNRKRHDKLRGFFKNRE